MQARIDRDQLLFQQLLEGQNQEDFDMAQKIYQLGGYSKSVSRINLGDPLPFPISAGANVTGKDKLGLHIIQLYAYESYDAGSRKISVDYVNDACYVGGLPTPVTSGCKPSIHTCDCVGKR